MHEKSFSVETKSSFDHFYSTFVVATKTNCFGEKSPTLIENKDL